MEAHAQAVSLISSTVRAFFSQEKAYRVYHGSSNSTRPSHDPTKENTVDISMLDNVVEIDVQKRIALVEPNVTMDKLVEATLPFGLVPPVVIEFPGITVGGGFSGTSGESSSFRHGFFDETVEGVEIVLGNGDVVRPAPGRSRSGKTGQEEGENEDLFHGATGAAGTLGIVSSVMTGDLIPFTRFCRWLLDDYSHTRTLYHALHASGVASQFVVQDLALPYEAAEDFVEWGDKELGIWPLWLCPLRGGYPLPTFRPVTEVQNGERAVSQPMLNIGVWGWGPADRDTFLAKNRGLEAKLVELRGCKWRYAHTYYTEGEFWSEYSHREIYDRLREKHFAGALPNVYDKVKPKPTRNQDKGHGKTPPLQSSWAMGSSRDYSSWLSAWPVGGLYGDSLGRHQVAPQANGSIGEHDCLEE